MMETERESKLRQIKKINFIIMSALIIIHIIFLFHSFILITPYGYYIHLTMWSFLLSSFYLIAILVTDSNLYFRNNSQLESFNKLIRNTFASIAYPFCYTITIGFWLISLLGLIFDFNAFYKDGSSNNIPGGVVITIYYHLFVAVIMTLDIFLNERSYANINFLHLIVNSIIALIYVVIICFDKYYFGNNAYVFMEVIGVGGFVGTVFGIYGLLVLSYFLYIFLVNRLNKNNIVQITKEERHTLLGAEGEEGVDL